MSELQKKSEKRNYYLLWIITITSCVLSVTSFFISKETLEFDKVNFIIATLAVLVTILLGIQIYNSIQVKNDLEKFEEKWENYKKSIIEYSNNKIKESEKNLSESISQVFSTIGVEFYTQFVGFTVSKDFPIEQKIIYRMVTLFYANQIDKIENVEQLYEHYKQVVKEFDKFIRDNEKEILELDKDIKKIILDKIEELYSLSLHKVSLSLSLDKLKELLME